MFAALAAFQAWVVARGGWTERLGDPDLWWQVWAGERILGGEFPYVNGMAFTAADVRWVYHEPLVGLIYAAVGIAHVGWVRGVVVTAGFALALHLGWRPKSAWATVFAAAFVAWMVFFGTTERALSWGNLCLAGTLALVVDAEGGVPTQRWRLAAATALVALWANVHGSFVIGVLVLLLTDWRWGLGAAALTLVNPNGAALWGLVAGYGAGGGAHDFVHEAVLEWAPIDPTDPPSLLRLAAMLGAGFLVASGSWRARILWLFTTALAIRYWRNCDVAGLTMAPFVAVELERRLPSRPMPHPAWVFVPLMAVTALLAGRSEVDPRRYPSQVLAAVPLDARVYSDFDLGGWVGWSGHQVFWDPRNDCYPEAVLADGLVVLRREPGWQDVLDRWQVDIVVTATPDLVTALGAEGWQVRATAGDVTVLGN